MDLETLQTKFKFDMDTIETNWMSVMYDENKKNRYLVATANSTLKYKNQSSSSQN